MVFLAVAPGVVAGLVPWLLTGWRPAGAPAWLQALGWIALAAEAAVLHEAFGRFVAEGVGTPAPVAPTERLVVGGLYRYVRNPMYLAVAAMILGQAAVLGRWVLVAYAVAFGATVWSFVHWYEEPALRVGCVNSAIRANLPDLQGDRVCEPYGFQNSVPSGKQGHACHESAA